MQNHRAVLKLPQGDSVEVSKLKLPVPESARTSREALRAWLRDEQHVYVENQRVPAGRVARAPGSAGVNREAARPRVSAAVWVRNWQLPRGLDWKIGQRAQESPADQR